MVDRTPRGRGAAGGASLRRLELAVVGGVLKGPRRRRRSKLLMHGLLLRVGLGGPVRVVRVRDFGSRRPGHRHVAVVVVMAVVAVSGGRRRAAGHVGVARPQRCGCARLDVARGGGAWRVRRRGVSLADGVPAGFLHDPLELVQGGQARRAGRGVRTGRESAVGQRRQVRVGLAVPGESGLPLLEVNLPLILQVAVGEVVHDAWCSNRRVGRSKDDGAVGYWRSRVLVRHELLGDLLRNDGLLRGALLLGDGVLQGGALFGALLSRLLLALCPLLLGEQRGCRLLDGGLLRRHRLLRRPLLRLHALGLLARRPLLSRGQLHGALLGHHHLLDRALLRCQ
ncbi:hypothetical protein FOCC_FOCC016608 [Frankliniella occidentalis]|nr:hypothetical protein FOCC_FOCC016608 [Frankliniella occidentalis]